LRVLWRPYLPHRARQGLSQGQGASAGRIMKHRILCGQNDEVK
jgi:hypothetical protein